MEYFVTSKGRLIGIDLTEKPVFFKSIKILFIKNNTIHHQFKWKDISMQKGTSSFKKNHYFKEKNSYKIWEKIVIYALYWKVCVRIELTYLALYKRGILIVEAESSQPYKNLQLKGPMEAIQSNLLLPAGPTSRLGQVAQSLVHSRFENTQIDGDATIFHW